MSYSNGNKGTNSARTASSPHNDGPFTAAENSGAAAAVLPLLGYRTCWSRSMPVKSASGSVLSSLSASGSPVTYRAMFAQTLDERIGRRPDAQPSSNDVGQTFVPRHPGLFDVDLRQNPVEPSGQPPVGLARQLHRRRYEDHSNDRSVDENGDCHTQPNHLDRRIRVGHERRED